MKTRILVLWSLPRSRSTAFEWMMRQRGDFHAEHEPFTWAYYFGEDRKTLREYQQATLPEKTFATMWRRIRDVSNGQLVFIKDFSYSILPWVSRELLGQMDHSFLIRDPRETLPSFHARWPDFTLEETSYAAHRRLYEMLCDQLPTPPPIVDSQCLVSDPEAIIRAYCAQVGIEFLPQALRWTPGDRREVSDYPGLWHVSLRTSTCFAAQQSDEPYQSVESDSRLKLAYDLCRPYYEWMYERRLRAL